MRSFLHTLRILQLHKLRSSLSTLGILFGVAAVITMLSIGEGAKRETLDQIEQLGLHNIIVRGTGEHSVLNHADKHKFEKMPAKIHLASSVKTLHVKLRGQERMQTAPEILEVDPEFFEIYEYTTSTGRLFNSKDVGNQRHLAVIGSSLSGELGKGGKIGSTLILDNIPFTIVGILEPRKYKKGKTAAIASRDLNQMIFLPTGSYHSFPRQTLLGQDHVNEIILKFNQTESIENASLISLRTLEKSHPGKENFQLIVPKQLIEQAKQAQRTFNLVLGSLACVSLVVGGIGIMNIMLATISERTREIGIRRALGATRRNIIYQFLVETLFLTWLGAIAGVVFGIGASFAISWIASWSTVVTPWSLILSVTMATLIGVASGIYPALEASRMNPINALRTD